MTKLVSHPIIPRSEYDSPKHAATPEFRRQKIDERKEHLKKYVILHSSGSTELPKSISFNNKRLILTFLTAFPNTAFLSVPLSHAHGLVTYVQHIYSRKTLWVQTQDKKKRIDGIKGI